VFDFAISLIETKVNKHMKSTEHLHVRAKRWR